MKVIKFIQDGYTSEKETIGTTGVCIVLLLCSVTCSKLSVSMVRSRGVPTHLLEPPSIHLSVFVVFCVCCVSVYACVCVCMHVCVHVCVYSDKCKFATKQR